MIELPFEAGSFTTVYADPPWWMVGSGRAAIKRQYPLMRTSEILGMGFEVQRVTKANAHCYLWVTNSFLFEGLKVMEAWGFRYITTITWLKDRIGLGHYFRGLTEHCLFGVRGMVPYRTTEEGKRAQGRTGFCAVRGGTRRSRRGCGR